MFSRLKWLPFELRVALLANIALLVPNLLWFGSQFGAKIDPGLATLLGAIVGLCVVAWQTNRGFKNLIRSQENQSRLEREARLHQYELERAGTQEDEEREKRLLLSGLRAEMVSLHSNAYTSAQSHQQFALIYKAMHEHSLPASIKEFTINGYKTPFYQQSISRLGLLNVTLAADIIKVYSMVHDDRKVVWEKAAPNSVVSVAYATGAVLAYKFNADLYHVGMRIRSFEEGTEDPGTLSKTEATRHAHLPKFEDMIPEKMV
ncbi:hypothetical protein [Tardiphaga sp. 862_B3_N1_1]|uniref:hypothetical protein n=1 Tax=Tardiphaga sp. 862_B3_N1_1 TaxID=3240763 RepID=UPI003F8C70B1